MTLSDSLKIEALRASRLCEGITNIPRFFPISGEKLDKLIKAMNHARWCELELASALASTLPPVPAYAGPVCVGEVAP